MPSWNCRTNGQSRSPNEINILVTEFLFQLSDEETMFTVVDGSQEEELPAQGVQVGSHALEPKFCAQWKEGKCF